MFCSTVSLTKTLDSFRRHGAELDACPWRLINSYHCSRLNTNTGRLTEPMFRAVFYRAREVLDG